LEEIASGLTVIKGSVNTAVLERNGKQLLIDSGEITSPPRAGAVEWALFTHHHRDQASGALRLTVSGTKLAVPAAERRFFEDAFRFWDSADNYSGPPLRFPASLVYIARVRACESGDEGRRYASLGEIQI